MCGVIYNCLLTCSLEILRVNATMMIFLFLLYCVKWFMQGV